MTSPSNSLKSSSPPVIDIYSHDPGCKFDHPIPDSTTLDSIINSVIKSYNSSNASITRESIENTIHLPLHILLIPAHKCKSPFAFHHHSSARTLFKQDYINIIHKELLTPKPQKLSASPTSTCTNNSSTYRPNSVKSLNYSLTSPPTSTSTSTSSKTLDQEINILASLWSESSQEVKHVYEVLEKCSEKIYEYMFHANRAEKESTKRIENVHRSKNIIEKKPSNSQLSNKSQSITNITTTDSNSDNVDVQEN